MEAVHPSSARSSAVGWG